MTVGLWVKCMHAGVAMGKIP